MKKYTLGMLFVLLIFTGCTTANTAANSVITFANHSGCEDWKQITIAAYECRTSGFSGSSTNCYPNLYVITGCITNISSVTSDNIKINTLLPISKISIGIKKETSQ